MFCPKCGIENPENGKFCRSCGTDLEIVSLAIAGNLQKTKYEVDPRKRAVSWETAITKLSAGLGLLIVAVIVGFSGVIGGNNWWFWLLIPAFVLLATGIAQFINLRKLEKLESTFTTENSINNISTFATNNALLPSAQTEFIKPQSTIYKTGEFVEPLSVTEVTTRQLEMNQEK
jgi:zinc-ribbon domain